jgi:predicted ArsR family transcriptional regulator
MSRGLGATQRRALAILSNTAGVTVPDLARALGVSERYGRTVVASLEQRRLVVAIYEDGARRAWLPKQRRDRERAEEFRRSHTRFMREMASRLPVGGDCLLCGQALPKRAGQRRKVAK